MPGSFFDTNVLLYLVADDTTKADRAEAVMQEGGAISVQVLNEITNVARRKLRLSWDDTYLLLDTVRSFLSVRPMTIDMHETGLSIARRYGFSVYDAMIASAALHAGCNTLWSEDLQHGMVLSEGLRIVDPFLEDGRNQPAASA